jgi:hypothetical protein
MTLSSQVSAWFTKEAKGTITLAWADNSANENGFGIERKTGLMELSLGLLPSQLTLASIAIQASQRGIPTAIESMRSTQPEPQVTPMRLARL